MTNHQEHQKQLRERIYYLHNLEVELAKKKLERAEVLYDLWADEVDKRLVRFEVIIAYRRLKFYRKTITDEIIRLDNIRHKAQQELDERILGPIKGIHLDNQLD